MERRMSFGVDVSMNSDAAGSLLKTSERQSSVFKMGAQASGQIDIPYARQSVFGSKPSAEVAQLLIPGCNPGSEKRYYKDPEVMSYIKEK